MSSSKAIPLVVAAVAFGSMCMIQGMKLTASKSKKEDPIEESDENGLAATSRHDLHAETAINRVDTLLLELDKLRAKLDQESTTQLAKDQEIVRLKEDVGLLRSMMRVLLVRIDGIPMSDSSAALAAFFDEVDARQCSLESSSSNADVRESNKDMTATGALMNGDACPNVCAIDIDEGGGNSSSNTSAISNTSLESFKSAQLAIRLHAENIISLTSENGMDVISRLSQTARVPAELSSIQESDASTADAKSGCIVGSDSTVHRNTTPQRDGASIAYISNPECSLTVPANSTTSFDTNTEELSERLDASFASTPTKGEKECICSSSLFSGHEAQIELFLPRLGMACKCGKRTYEPEPIDDDDDDEEEEDETSLINILRPWQVHFLESVGIITAQQLIEVEQRDASKIAKAMKAWRKEHHMAHKVKTKQCYIALHVWARTAKVVLNTASLKADDVAADKTLLEEADDIATDKKLRAEVATDSKEKRSDVPESQLRLPAARAA